jgi:hypothetical protein
MGYNSTIDKSLIEPVLHTTQMHRYTDTHLHTHIDTKKLKVMGRWTNILHVEVKYDSQKTMRENAFMTTGRRTLHRHTHYTP